MKPKRLFVFVGIVLIFLGFSGQSIAFSSIPVKMAKEIVKKIGIKFGKEGTEELIKRGGETAVKEILEKALKEGGETLVKRVAHYADEFGVSALHALKGSPKVFVEALDKLPNNLVKPALREIATEPALAQTVLKRYGKEALEVAAKHRGVGLKIANTLGDDGIRTAMKLETNNAIRLARYSDDIGKLPAAEKSKILEKIGKFPEKIFDLLEKHPQVLKTAKWVAIVIALEDSVLGSTEPIPVPATGIDDKTAKYKPGIIERIWSQTTKDYRQELSWLFVILGLFVSSYFSVKIWHAWKISKIRQAREESR